jgi:hypothetical protein
MRRILALLVLALSGCASTTIYENGKPVLRTQADVQNLTFVTSNGTKFHADSLNHSLPTRAGGSVVGTTGAAIAASGLTTLIP